MDNSTALYALMGRVAELSDGAVRMGPGTLYGTLNRLVDDGLIEETTDRGRRDEPDELVDGNRPSGPGDCVVAAPFGSR